MNLIPFHLHVWVVVADGGETKLLEHGLGTQVAAGQSGQGMLVGHRFVTQHQVLVRVVERVAVNVRVIGVNFEAKFASGGGVDGEDSHVVHHAVHHVASQRLLVLAVALQLHSEAHLFGRCEPHLGEAVDSTEDGAFLQGLQTVLGCRVARTPACVHAGRERLRLEACRM